MANVAIVEAALRLDAKQFTKGIEQAKDSVGKLAADTRAQFAAAGAGLLAVSAGAGTLALGLKKSGDQALELRKTLAGAFTGKELDDVAAQVERMSTLNLAGFAQEDFVEGAKRIGVFSDQVGADLIRVANIAAKSGESFGSLQDYFAQLTVNPEAYEQFKELAGITPARLVQFGAVLDKTGQKIDITGKNAELAAKAFRAVADADFSGSFDKMSSSTDKLSSDIQLLSREVGVELAKAFDNFAGKISPVVKSFRGLSSETKGLVGIGVLTASVAAGVGALGIAAALAATSMLATVGAAGGFAVVLAPVGALLAPIVGSLAAFAAAGLTATTIVVGLHKAYEGLNSALEGDLKLQGEILATELERQAYQKLIPQFLGKTAQQLYDVGLTAMDAGKAIDGLYQQRAQASSNGATDLVKTIDQRIAAIEQAKMDLTKLEDRDRGRVAARATSATPEAKATEEKARADRAAKEKAARDADLKEELDAIDLRFAREEIGQAEVLELRKAALDRFKADEAEKRALAIETARFETQAANDAAKQGSADSEQARKKKYDDELTRIDLLKTQRKISAQQEADLLKKVLQDFNLTQGERVTTLKAVAAIENGLLDSTAAKRKAILDKQAADDKAAADARVALIKQNSADLEDAQAQARGLKSAGLDRKVDSLQEDTQATGKDNTAAIKAAAEEKLKLDLEAIRIEGDKQKAATESAEARSQIEANTLERIKAAQEAATDSLKSELQQQLDALAKFEADKKKARGAFSLGTVTGIDQLGENTGGYGISRRAEAISPVSTANLFANVAAPQSTVSNDPSMDKLSAAADKLLAAAGKLSTAADKPTKVTVNTSGTGAASSKTTSVNGRMGAYEKAGRGIGGMVGAR